MAFRIITGDITKYNGDVIINSVGVTSTIYDGICGSIVKASESDELKKIIDGVNDVYSVGEYFITQGYKLPVSNIFHLITPNYDDDPYYKQFKECIRRILNECKYRHWRKIGFPSIGTGANKYDKVESRKIIKEMCESYCEIYTGMDITLVLPEGSISFDNDARIARESYSGREYHDPETMAKFKKGSKLFGATFEEHTSGAYSKKYFAYDNFSKGRDDITFKLTGIKTIGQYVDAYVEEKWERDSLSPSTTKIKQKINLYFAYGKKGKDDYIHAGSDAYGEIKNKSTADKKQLFKIILALRMTYTEATTFLVHFGYGFAAPGVSEIDDAVRYLISQRQYGIVEVELEFKKRKLQSIFKK